MLFQISSEVTNDCNSNINSHFSPCFHDVRSMTPEIEKKVKRKSPGVIFPGVGCRDLAPEPFRINFQDQEDIMKERQAFLPRKRIEKARINGSSKEIND